VLIIYLICTVYRYKQEGAKFESQSEEIFSSINTF